MKKVEEKMSVGAKILTGYGLALIVILLCIGISSNWTYFNNENILLLAFIIASFPILGMFLTILEVAFGKEGGF